MPQASENSEPIVTLENFIKLSNVAWKFLQIDLFDESLGVERILNRKDRIKKSLKKTIVWFNIVVLLSHSVNRMITTIPFNIEKFSFSISVFAAIFLAVVKYCNIIWNQARISAILRILPEHYTKEDSVKFGIKKTYDKFNRFIRIYTCFLFSAVFQIVLGPLKEYRATGQRTFPFNMIFWFDATSNLAVYISVFACCVYLSILNRAIVLSNDKILCGLVIVVSVEFEILKIKFSELKLMNEADAKIQLKELVKRHQQLIFCAQEIQNIFSLTFFSNFIMSSFFICFTGFHMSTTSEISSMITDMVFCAFSLINIFMQCFIGQMIRDASDGVAGGVFDCDWEMMKDVQMRKDLLFVMKRAQKGVQFLILDKWPVNIEQFANVSFGNLKI
jgi:hypothetical protein